MLKNYNYINVRIKKRNTVPKAQRGHTMKRNKYTYSFIVLILLAMFFNVPLKVVATEYSTNDQEITYDYYDTASESFKTATLSANSYTLVTSSSTTWTSGFYVLGSNIDIQERVKIDGNVTLILAGENTLNCTKGIEVTKGNTFNKRISCQWQVMSYRV